MKLPISTPHYEKSSKSVPRVLFMDAVGEAFYTHGGWGFNQKNNSKRKNVFFKIFKKQIVKTLTEKIISNN